MDKYFRFDNKESIIIYGAAAVGLIVYDICKELDILVEGFLDKRGDEIAEFQGLKVWNINENELDNIDKNKIIFVAVKNVFEHDNIARTLINKGFSNIVYRPSASIKGNGNENENFLNEVYDKFMDKELVEADIPKTFEIHQYEYKDYATIRKTENERIVYVPIESLFTDKKKAVKEWSWLDIPIMALVPHIAFFRWMDQQEGFSPEKYLEFCTNSANLKGKIKTTECWKENVIKNRADVYANMNESLQRDYDFFIRNAPTAKWNPGGYFNLVSGKHRATFWLAKGRRYIPLKISEEDFEKWVNKQQTEQLIERLRKLNAYEFHAPITHPYFYDISCMNRNLYYKLLCDFIFKVASEQYEKLDYVRLQEIPSVILSLNDDGYIARALQGYGMGVEVYNKSTICTALDDLVVRKSEKTENRVLDYAFIEYNYGQELDFRGVLNKAVKYMVCLVAVKDINEFERTIHKNYSIVKCRDAFMDDKNIKIYQLENRDAVWKERFPKV